MNHWVNASPPDPGKAAQANDPKLLKSRLEECAAERGRMPNVVAVDFSVRGKIAATVRDVASALRDRARGTPDTTPTTEPPTTTTTPPPSTLPPAEPAPALPNVTTVTTLTGGDPTQLCTALVNMAPVLSAWAYAEFSATEQQQGEADLVYGPALVRLVTAYEASAPVELATLAKPLLDRATAAVAVLRQLGLDDAAIAALADQAIAATATADGPDGVTLQATLAAVVAGKVGADPLATASTLLPRRPRATRRR